MKAYNNDKIGVEEIRKNGFYHSCNQRDLTDKEKDMLLNFIMLYVKDGVLTVNTEDMFDIYDAEVDFEIGGGEMELECDDLVQAEKLCDIFHDITLLRCTVNKFKDGIAYCDFESE